jgi:hypothetical protein
MSTRYRVSTPVKDFTGEVGGCLFAKGIYEGDVQPGPLAYFRAQGYSVQELDDTPEPEATEPELTFADDPKVPPAGNASEADWRFHCLAIGATDDQVKDLKRDQLKELAAKITKEPQA